MSSSVGKRLLSDTSTVSVTGSSAYISSLINSKMMRMPGRVQVLKNDTNHTKNVLYLIQRDQRVFDNHCVFLGYELTQKLHTKFYMGVKFEYLKLNCRQKTMAIEGFREMEEACRSLSIPLARIDDIEAFIRKFNIDTIITDYSPLREAKRIINYLVTLPTALYVCDSHNIIPAVLLTEYKRTCAAVRRLLVPYYNDYCVPYPKLTKHKYNDKEEIDNICTLNVWPECEMKNKYVGGYTTGMKELMNFFQYRLSDYKALRNKPDEDKLSRLSPWLHLGQISPLTIILKTFEKTQDENTDSFINEIFTWRELADHFCMHEENYDNIDGALAWAQETLETHTAEKRLYTYTFDELLKAQTHDKVWNAGQKQMLLTGKMHGYIRMYWAKSMLKWSQDPRTAIEYAVKLNDMLSIDGNDPNGYLGIMWSICGSMDQGFMERPVIGKIRPMSQPKAPKYTHKWSEAYLDPKLLQQLLNCWEQLQTDTAAKEIKSTSSNEKKEIKSET